MSTESQKKAPISEALTELKKARVVPFDVPGHKRGRGNPELAEFLGEECLSVDVNSQKPLDNLCHPVSVIREAELLAADAFGCKNVLFMVGGTTASVQAMILSVCKKDEKIILPRNVHRSVINALILCGGVPVYVNPLIHQRLGIPLGMSLKEVKSAIEKNPDAKAVLINNPTYYGICSDITEITRLAHEKGMLVIADEAHGAHFYFGKNLPVSAMAAGADLSAVSMHKSGGSLTQSSFLLLNDTVNVNYVRQVVNLTQTTSASYLLMASLDLSRKNLALNGERLFSETMKMADYAREEINRIGDYYAFSKELTDNDAFFDFDTTKLSIHTLETGLAGKEVYDLLRDEYDIQIEFGDLANILAYLSPGDRQRDLERLVSALSEIRRRHKKSTLGMLWQEYISPKVVETPQNAFYSDEKSMPFKDSAGKVCSEFIMSYPPGIPILAPGELITSEIIEHVEYSKEKGFFLTGAEDPAIETIRVMA